MCPLLGRMLRVAKGMDEKVGHSGQCCFGRCEFGGAACTVPPKIEDMWGKGFTLWNRGMVCIRQDSPL